MPDKNRQPVVGDIVHYINRRSVHHAAIVSHVYQDNKAVDLYVIANISWRKPRHKATVSYSQKTLNRTWHYLDDHK